MLSRLLARWPISRLALESPPAAPGRAGIALILIVRDEERHIGEWAAFHLAAGAAHVYAYDNGCRDRTTRRLHEALGDRLTVIPWAQKLHDATIGREIHNQILAYAHAIRNFGSGYRWMAPLDADEFLVPVRAGSLEPALAPLGQCGAISLPWHSFGRCGHRTPPEGGVIANYTRRAADPMSGARGVSGFKTVLDPARVTALKVHVAEIDGARITWNDAGARFPISQRDRRTFYSREAIQLNHYYTRSEEELAAKIARGSNRSVAAAAHADRVRRNVANIEAEEVEDRTAPDFLARIGAALSGEIARAGPKR